MFQRIMLIGRLGRDPEMRFTPDGTPVTSFTVATDRRWTDANGQQQQRTVWFRVSAWRRQGARDPLRRAFWGACGVGLFTCILVVLTLVVRDWNDVLYPGRYAWESASVVGLLWARGWFAFREQRVRVVGLGITFAGMVFLSVWVGNWIIQFFAQHPPV